MKQIVYHLKYKRNIGTEQNPVWEESEGPVCSMPYSEDALELAQREAYGAVTVEDDGQPEPEALPSVEDTLLDMAADMEYRICLLELGGETT